MDRGGGLLVVGRFDRVVYSGEAYGKVLFYVQAGDGGAKRMQVKGVWPKELGELKEVPCGITIRVTDVGESYQGETVYKLVESVPETLELVTYLLEDPGTVKLAQARLSHSIYALISKYGTHTLVQSVAAAPADKLVAVLTVPGKVSKTTATVVADRLKKIFTPEYAAFVAEYPLLTAEQRYHVWDHGAALPDPSGGPQARPGIDFVQAAPYRAAEVAHRHHRHKFEDLDRMALRIFRLEAGSPERFRRFGVEGVKALIQGDNHTHVPAESAIRKTLELLKIRNTSPLYQGVWTLLMDNAWKNGIAPAYAEYDAFDVGTDWAVQRDGDVVYPKPHLEAEHRIVQTVHGAPPKVLEPMFDLEGFDPAQREAIHTALAEPVMILTGPPGTGKTRTTTRIIIELISAGYTVAACSFTGKAVQRLNTVLQESDDWEPQMAFFLHLEAASTIHKIFKSRAPDADRPLAVVVDETSMVALQALAALMYKLRDATRWVFVGDSFQLPSIAPGRVLYDMVSSGRVPTKMLDVVHRQAGDGRTICENAMVVRRFIDEDQRGTLVAPESRVAQLNLSTDEFVLTDRPFDPITASQTAIDWYAQHGNRFEKIQVLCHLRHSCAAINSAVRDVVNPSSAGKAQLHQHDGSAWRVGDRVMCIRNQYEARGNMVCSNGDAGTIAAIRFAMPDEEGGMIGGESNRVVQVCFDDGREVLFNPRRFQNVFVWAYAITIHKSQGSEWDHVLLFLDGGKGGRLTLAHVVYTGFTRAAKSVILDGEARTLERALSRTDAVHQRRSDLASKF